MAYEASEAAPRCCDVRRHTLDQPQGGTWLSGVYTTAAKVCRSRVWNPLVRAARCQKQQEVAVSDFVHDLCLGPSCIFFADLLRVCVRSTEARAAGSPTVVSQCRCYTCQTQQPRLALLKHPCRVQAALLLSCGCKCCFLVEPLPFNLMASREAP